MIAPGRRCFLRGSLAAAAWLGTPTARRAWADSAPPLLGLPKLALVIGNNDYRRGRLKNPVNDAQAMADVLKQTAFDVSTKLNAGRAEMMSAIQTYADTVAKKKAVGLFYFAGHGVQLAWRNYLLPVDTVIDRFEDVEPRAVDVNALLAGLTQAKNPMNLIILDACRSDPFGTDLKADQKGLSQMDAPPGTLLAYATAPGNVAADGDGTNGLYTEHLVRELKAPGAKVEDVFKRVRLGVRRKSLGRQIPWESTSLEEDFYFVPPPQLKKLSDAEKEKRFKEELALWEKVQRATEPGPLEEYLRRYPSGNFTELAQLQLERVLARLGEKKIEMAAEANPYSKGSAVANTDYKVGDSYTYRELQLPSMQERTRYTAVITKISDGEVVFSNGAITDLLGNLVRTLEGATYSPSQNVPMEYAVGRQWTTRYTILTPERTVLAAEAEFKIVTRESVTVPAGTFNAFRVESKGRSWGRSMTEFSMIQWFAPDKLRRRVAYERRVGPRQGGVRAELMAYKEN